LNIAVIGAGISGLACAAALQRAGHGVQVFDKSRGVGGRMSTRKGDGWQADHGAPYFEAHASEFRAAVAEWCEAGAAALWLPRLKMLKNGGWQDGDARVDKFVGVPGMTSPARLLAATLNVNLQTTINKLIRRAVGGADNGFRWHLQSVEHGWLETQFDAVLIAIPAPQASNLLADIDHPFAVQATAVSMQGCWVLMMQYAAPLDLAWDAAEIHDGLLSWVARDSAKPGLWPPKQVGEQAGEQKSDTWVLHASAEWSAQNIERPAIEVADAMINAFRNIGGSPPQSSVAHRWRYAGVAAGVTASVAATVPALWDASQCLGLCGDWLNGGQVEGAWRSGRALAAHIASA